MKLFEAIRGQSVLKRHFFFAYPKKPSYSKKSPNTSSLGCSNTFNIDSLSKKNCLKFKLGDKLDTRKVPQNKLNENYTKHNLLSKTKFN